MSNVSLINGHVDSIELGIEGLYTVCKSLQETSGRKDKEKIISENKHYNDFTDLMIFLFDNNITTGLDIKKINKQIFIDGTTTIVPVDKFKDILNYVKTHNTGSNIDIINVQCSIINVGKQKEYIDFLNEIVTKSLRLGIDTKTVNKVYGYELVPTFDVQLGTSIEDVKLNGDEEIFITQKLNGTRCVYFDGKLWTRSGKQYVGCEHIIKDIKKMFADAGYRDSAFVLDGELVLKDCGLSDSEAFQKGTGIANSHNETKEELKYVIFDILDDIDFRTKHCETKYSDRKMKLLELAPFIRDYKSIDLVRFFYRGYDHNKIWEYLDYAEENDMEGIIINLDTPYQFKRVKSLIKVKKFNDIDLRCIRIEKGEKGKYKDTLGAIVCRYKDGEVRVGSGFTEEQRNDFFNNPGKIINEIVTIKYKEATKNKNGTESLQFPVFVCVRTDKLVANDEQ